MTQQPKTNKKLSARRIINTQGGEYNTYYEYKATNTTIYSWIQSI